MFKSDVDNGTTTDVDRGLTLKSVSSGPGHEELALFSADSSVKISTAYSTRYASDAEKRDYPGLESVLIRHVYGFDFALAGHSKLETRQFVREALEVYLFGHQDNHQWPVEVHFVEIPNLAGEK